MRAGRLRTVVRAPLRISFGGGADLDAYAAKFGGFVLSAAITRYCYVVVESTLVRACRITAADYSTSKW